MKKFILDRNFEDSIDTLCKKCNELKSKCICIDKSGIKKSKFITKQLTSNKIHYEVRKINGNIISIFYPFYKDNAEHTLKELKKKLACGGSIRDTNNYFQIILQGDVVDKVLKLLGSK